jgi:hypothetical protein
VTISPRQVELHLNGDCSPGCPCCAIEDAAEPRLFIVPDGCGGYGDPCVWARREHEPACVLHSGDVGDPALWAGIVRLVEGGGV